MNETLHRTWPGAVLAVLGLLYIWIGLAAHGWDRVFGIVGGVLILAAAEAIRRQTATSALGLLLLGSLPLAVATWWSIVTPGLAILTLLMGSLALRRNRNPAKRRDTTDGRQRNQRGTAPETLTGPMTPE